MKFKVASGVAWDSGLEVTELTEIESRFMGKFTLETEYLQVAEVYSTHSIARQNAAGEIYFEQVEHPGFTLWKSRVINITQVDGTNVFIGDLPIQCVYVELDTLEQVKSIFGDIRVAFDFAKNMIIMLED